MLLAVDSGELNRWKGKQLSDIAFDGTCTSTSISMHIGQQAHFRLCPI